jgi:hemoglobin-like flavoprotein
MLDNKTIDNDLLNFSDVEIIQSSWMQVEGSIELAIDFYNKLFYLYPSIRPLFKEDIRTQARKFTAHLSFLVKNINSWSYLHKDVEDLGKRHVQYEVKTSHYEQVRLALFHALKIHLKNSWTPETELAWTKFYMMVADKMKEAHH